MGSITFTVIGPPATKKNSARIILGKGGKPRLIQSARAVAWENDAALQLASQFRGRSTIEVPVSMKALVYLPRDYNTGDLGNYLAAVCDALEVAEVVENDRLIGSFDGSRLMLDKKNPRVEIELSPLAGC